jgi:SAM-dependent methyltransferase
VRHGRARQIPQAALRGRRHRPQRRLPACCAAEEPRGEYTPADILDFDLGGTYDVVCSLFSAIGIVRTFARLERAIASMVRHVRPGGALIIEPWFTPEQWHPARPFILAGEVGDDKVYRMSNSRKEGQLSVLLHNYLRSTSHGVEHYSERIELGLFTRDEMTWAFEFSGMETLYDPEGLMGRGLYLGKHNSEISTPMPRDDYPQR